LIGVAILLQARSFYVIYVRKISTRATVIVTWASLAFMVGFWSWYLLLGGRAYLRVFFMSWWVAIMLTRAYAGLALGCVAVFLSGCGNRPEGNGIPPGKKAPAAEGAQLVTLHVQDMKQRLNLFWLDWPNKVQKALEGLWGVESVAVDEADLEKDWLHVQFDPGRVTPEELLQSVGMQGFVATIVERWLAMRSFFQSFMRMLPLGSNRQDAEVTPMDVTMLVPAMNWPSGWPDRVRKALGTLPWVELATIQIDVAKRELRFNLKDKGAFNEDDVKQALKAQGFAKAELKSGPF
jgi:hypothetical protein